MKYMNVAAALLVWTLSSVAASTANDGEDAAAAQGPVVPPRSAIPWRVPSYTLTARSMPVREALETFGVAQGIAVISSAAVQGAFSGNFKDVPASEFLDRLATIHNLTWYYDGASIYVYGAGEIMTTLTDLKYMKAGDVRKMLGELGVEDARFPIKTTSNDELIMVSGPPRYVQLIMTTIESADRLMRMRTVNEIETRIFPLKNTWADNVSLRVTGPESTTQIKGVAQLLQEIMVSSGQLGVRDASTNAVDEAEARVRESAGYQFTPVIRADNRLNAVIVRDSATRMEMYERLIAELDVPQRLVEISVTTVEMSKNDSLDWQLSLSARGSHRDIEAGAGQNARNLFSPDSIGGSGLAGALTYLGSHVQVSASISALRQKGKARDISRTSLVTMNNMAAEMTDTQSYHARCVGTEVATLEEVSAGTKLSIKPRIIETGDASRPFRVWLTMELQDGGFDTISVDSMPMTRQSTLETQMAVYDGQSVMLAGYFRDIKEEGGWGIPWLRDIPWIGWLFGGASWNNETVQRLFIVTPYVVDFGPGDLVRAPASRARDITLEESLDREREHDDRTRKIREMRIDEEERERDLETEDYIRREKGEISLRRDMSDESRTERFEDWEDDYRHRREDWETGRDERREIRRAVRDAAEADRERSREASRGK